MKPPMAISFVTAGPAQIHDVVPPTARSCRVESLVFLVHPSITGPGTPTTSFADSEAFRTRLQARLSPPDDWTAMSATLKQKYASRLKLRRFREVTEST